MTSKTHSVDPYAPRYIESRVDNPFIVPSTHKLLSRSITASSNFDQFTKQPITPIGSNVIRNRDLPDPAIPESIQSRQYRQFQNMPRSVINENNNNTAFNQTTRPSAFSVSNQDQRTNEIDRLPNNFTNQPLPKNNQRQTTTTELLKTQPQQAPKTVDDTQPANGFWKTGTLFNSQGIVAIGPIVYDENNFAGPFGLNRVGTYIFYIGMAIFTLLAGIFLIMTAIFYSQNYPDATKNTSTLAGIAICAFAFYLGLQLILIGLWSQKYRQEHPKKKIPHKKPRLVYTPFGYYLYPQYFADINEQIHMQGYGLSNKDQNAKSPPATKPVEIKPVKPEMSKTEIHTEVVQQPIVPRKPEFYFLQSISDTNEQVATVEEKVVSTAGTKHHTIGKSSTDIDPQSNTKKGLKSRDDKTISGTRRTLGVGSNQVPTTSQIDNLDDADQTTKIIKNKTSSIKLISNAFYDDKE
ncbi:hypothetical protein I4U23_024849 [Adineta vaga]|nr:hypothetical protein I4U23_024849 [Adineta vaga]